MPVVRKRHQIAAVGIENRASMTFVARLTVMRYLPLTGTSRGVCDTASKSGLHHAGSIMSAPEGDLRTLFKIQIDRIVVQIGLGHGLPVDPEVRRRQLPSVSSTVSTAVESFVSVALGVTSRMKR